MRYTSPSPAKKKPNESKDKIIVEDHIEEYSFDGKKHPISTGNDVFHNKTYITLSENNRQMNESLGDHAGMLMTLDKNEAIADHDRSLESLGEYESFTETFKKNQEEMLKEIESMYEEKRVLSEKLTLYTHNINQELDA